MRTRSPRDIDGEQEIAKEGEQGQGVRRSDITANVPDRVAISRKSGEASNFMPQLRGK